MYLVQYLRHIIFMLKYSVYYNFRFYGCPVFNARALYEAFQSGSLTFLDLY